MKRVVVWSLLGSVIGVIGVVAVRVHGRQSRSEPNAAHTPDVEAELAPWSRAT